jgi:hypothetical protein
MNGKGFRCTHLERGRLALPIVAVLIAIVACSPGLSTPIPPFGGIDDSSELESYDSP